MWLIPPPKMPLNFSDWLTRNDRFIHRLLEILPGLVSWSLILFPVWGSFFIPLVVAYYILAFDVYWFYRSISMAFFTLLSYFKIRASQKYDWLKDIKDFGDWQKIHHIIIIPTFKEPIYMLRRNLHSIKQQSFPKNRVSIVLAFEQREGKAAQEKAKVLKTEFGRSFANILTTFHPDIQGEVKGKSSNTSYAAKIAKKIIINKLKVNLDYTLITLADADTCLHEEYLSCLTYKFLDSPERYNLIFQPAIMYYNNIWRIPAPIRVFSTTSTLVQIGLLSRKDRLINFSTYSTSLKMIDHIGYWDVDVIPEDYRLFFKAFFILKGKLEVEPIFLPVFADAVLSTSFWKTMKNQYEQVKRWAWGVSDDAYIIKKWLTVPGLPFLDKTIRVFKVIEDHFLWPVNWFIITLGATLPPLINKDFSRTIIGKRLPQTASFILTLTLIALMVALYIDIKQRPKIENISIWRKIIIPFEFLLLPVIGFFFTALPGLDAHTRLMLGRYIEYRVTEKV
jgi:cellulose synthase/poly-beta-1,6-N-acetylglucosamine synthase-like glycosyltransferase